MRLRLISLVAMVTVLMSSATTVVTHADHAGPGLGSALEPASQPLADCNLDHTASAPQSHKCPPPTRIKPTQIGNATATPGVATPTTIAPPASTATGKPNIATSTPGGPTVTPAGPAATPSGPGVPYPGAPLCPDSCHAHDYGQFHTLWDAARGCHYDHEHGADPFTADVAAAFPGFDLRKLLGSVAIGHTNPSSAMENTHKHGGMKWQVDLAAPQGCATGFEGGNIAVDAYAIQFHAFGAQSVEFEARQHSTTGLLRQCAPGNPSDKGYVFFNQLQEYGERCLPYQGLTLPYPDNFQTPYDCARGPYFTTDGVGPCDGCRPSRQFVLDHNLNANSIWTSKPTGSGARPPGSTLFNLLFRVRDTPQLFDANDMTHPFSWLWLCSADGGATFAPVAGCRFNNSTVTIHEVAGRLPAAWDNLAGFDTDSRVGRLTAEGYVTHFGTLNPRCTAPGVDCHPIQLYQAFVGF